MKIYYRLFIVLLICLGSCTKPKQETAVLTSSPVLPPVAIDSIPPKVVSLDSCKPAKVINLKSNKNSIVTHAIKHSEAGGFPFIKNYNTEQGLGLTSIASTYTDSKGNIWIGTYGGGVSKYDGKSFTNYTASNGLAGNVIIGITEDNLGNLWFGTNGAGVSKFNGKYFETYTTENGLPSNLIHCIKKGKEGDIWFGTSNGIAIYNPINKSSIDKKHCFRTYTTNDGLSNNSVSCFALDKDNNMWVGTTKGLNKAKLITTKNGEILSFTNYTRADGLTNEHIRCIYGDSSGNIWVGGAGGGGISKHSHNSPTNSPFFRPIPEVNALIGASSVYFICEDRYQNIWFSSGNKLFKLKSKGDQTFKIVDYSEDPGLFNKSIYTCTQSAQGNLWLGTNSNGLYKDENSTVIIYNEDSGRVSGRVWSIAEDNENKLWFGTSAGLSILSEKTFTKVTRLNELSVNIRGIVKDKKGKLWWVSAGGLCKYDNNSITYYTTEQGLVYNPGLCIIQDKKDNIWYGTYSGGLSKFNERTFTNYTTEQGLANNIVKCLLEDKQGNIWVGTNGGGISKFNGKYFTNYSTAQGLAHNNILSLFQDHYGNIWIGTNGGGLSLYSVKREHNNKSSFINYTIAEGLSDNVIYAITEDTIHHILWLGTNKGLSGLKLDSAFITTGIPQFEIYNQSTGYPIKDVNTGAMYIDSKGFLWAGTGETLIRFDYNTISRSKKPLKVNIEALKILEEDISWNFLKQAETDSNKSAATIKNEEVLTFGYQLNNAQHRVMHERFGAIQFDSVSPFNPVPINLVLPYTLNKITFEFGAIETERPELVRYRFFLEGYDNDWIPVTEKNAATYGNIYEGTYTFKVKAQSPEGVWSEPIRYTFKVLPPWYRTWWMYVIYLLTTITTIVAVIKWRISALKKEKDYLEYLVKERTAEVVEQKELVEKKNEQIEEKQKEIVDSINYAKRIQYTLLAHETLLKKNIPDFFIFFQPKDIVSGDFYWATETTDTNGNKRFYLAACDSTGHGVPGAFMSLLNISFLNEAITEKKIVFPNEILNHVRNRLVESISQDGAQDGMDGVLIGFEWPETKQTPVCTYAAAHNSPLIIRNNEVLELPTDKMPVGKGEKNESFKLHHINCQKGDMIYCYTDGFADQFGGPKGKKFNYKQLDKLLIEIHQLPMASQQLRLKTEFENWKGSLDQIDDVLIIGFKI